MKRSRSSLSVLGLLGLCSLALVTSCGKRQGLPLLRGEEVTWKVEYKGWACGDFTPQLMPIGGVEDGLDLSEVELGLEFYVPPELSAPDQIEEIRVPGNLFLIRGHFYYREDHGEKIVQPRFDLLGWEPVAPLRRWDDGGAVEVENRLETFGQSVEASSVEPGALVPAGKYLSC